MEFYNAELLFSVTTIEVLNVLECIRHYNKKIKYFQPTSSNMFGDTNTKSQNEETKFNPMSIYALGKYQRIIYAKCITKFMACTIVAQFLQS